MSNKSSLPLISVIVPCFNEEEVIETTHRRLSAALDAIDCDAEIVYVNDGSTDRTGELLQRLHSEDPRVCVVEFARNFGHQMAVTAGIDQAGGDAVVVIDADLQDPPQAIPQMVQLWKEGYQVVYGQRVERPGEPRLRLAAIRLFYRGLRWCSDTPMPMDSGDFRLLDRQVVDALRRMPEHDRYLRGMISWAGFRQVALPYCRSRRFAGVSKYPLSKLVRLAADAVLSFSMAPLRLATGLGLVTLLVALMAGCGMSVAAILGSSPAPTGWLALAISMFAAVQLTCLGIVGEYVGRIYREIKQRPLYLVSQTLPRREAGQLKIARAA